MKKDQLLTSSDYCVFTFIVILVIVSSFILIKQNKLTYEEPIGITAGVIMVYMCTLVY